MTKEKFYRVLKNIINPTVIKVIIFLVPVVLLIVFKAIDNSLSFENIFDVQTFVAIIIAFICEIIAYSIENVIGRVCEDATKLTTDYNTLIKKYSRMQMIDYQGKKFPVEQLVFRYYDQPPFDIVIDHSHSSKNYQLPTQVATNSDCLMQAHKFSVVYNSMSIRLDDLRTNGNKVELLYSRTYYYDSLITNRVMDYKLNNGKTIRDIYEPGPFLNSLKDSKLSNHLGFNGFIELQNGKIIFVERDNDLSIGKRTLGCSVSASLKSAYALEDDRTLSVNGLNKAIIEEIKKELNIDIDNNIEITKGIFGFCRDLLEGGKPQFIFYWKTNLSEEEFRYNFEQEVENLKKDKHFKNMDGSKFLLLTIDDLEHCTIQPDKMIINEKNYKMMPFTSASIVFLLKYLRKENL